MAEKIKIAELNIDQKQLVASLQQTKAEIKSLSEEQKALRKSGEDTSKTYIKNEARLKSLRGAYNQQIKVLDAATKSNAQLNAALQKEVKSIDEASKNNKELRAIRNQVNATTEEGAKKIAEINAKIDENNNLIKQNSSGLEKQKQNIGNYNSFISKARVATVAFGAALKATGIGLITAAVAGLTRAFGQNQKVMNVVSGITNSFGIVVSDLVNFIVDGTEKFIAFAKAAFQDPQAAIEQVGQKIKENLTERFESAIETAGLLGDAVKKLFSGDFQGALETAQAAGKEFTDVLTGVDGSFEKVTTSVSNYGKEVIKQANNQTALTNSAKLAEAQNKRLIEQYDRQAEQLRQIRDDENLTFEQRVAANEKLGQVLNEQEKAMVQNADIAVRLAQEQLNLNDTIDNRVALTDALAEKEGILAQIEGFRSEQLTNRVQLEREANEQREAERQAELERVQSFEDAKQELENAAALRKAETDLEREELRIENEFEKHLADLERMNLNEQERTELLLLLQQQRDDALAVVDTTRNKQRKETRTKEMNEELAQREAFASARIGIAQSISNGLKSVFGEESALAKAGVILEKGAAIARIISSTAVANAKAVAASPLTFGQPFVTANTASAAASIASVASQAVAEFARGGVLEGASHAHGGIPFTVNGRGGFEAEGGEAIINKRSTAAFRPLLSAINEAGGGRKFNDGGIVGASTPSTGDIINYERLAQAVSNLPAPVVSVEEVVDTASTVQVIESQASF